MTGPGAETVPGESGAATPPASDAPALSGTRVLDLASVGPAARASRILSDYGADVIKIGPVPRDGAKQIVPPYYAYSGGRGQRRLALDLKADAGRDTFLRLVSSADVVIESFRPGVMDRLGIGWEVCREANPGLVFCSTSGYGQTGPKSQWAGHDLNYLAAGGFLDCTGRRSDGGPALPGATVADIAAGGMQAAMAILAALLGRWTTGEGRRLDVSIADGVLAMMSLYTDEYLAEGRVPGPGHYVLTGRYAWYDVYECAGGGWISVGAIEPAFFARLCEGLGCPQFLGRQYDDHATTEMRAAFAAAFATRTRDEWVAELGPADCCVAAVLTVPEALADPQYVARGAVVEAQHPTAGTFRQTAPLLAGTVPPPPGGYQVSEQSVTDPDGILAEAGLSPAEIGGLRDAGAVA